MKGGERVGDEGAESEDKVLLCRIEEDAKLTLLVPEGKLSNCQEQKTTGKKKTSQTKGTNY